MLSDIEQARIIRERTNRTVEIIGSQIADRQAVERAISYYVRSVERRGNWWLSGEYGTMTPEQKQAAKRVLEALQGLSSALYDGDGRLRDDLAWIAWIDFPMKKIDLEKWIERAQKAANKRLPKTLPRRGSSAPAKRFAAEVAAHLATEHGIPLTCSRSPNNKFVRLAAAICGDRLGQIADKGFFQHCCAVVAARRGNVALVDIDPI
jgi:hypothetical protein